MSPVARQRRRFSPIVCMLTLIAVLFCALSVKAEQLGRCDISFYEESSSRFNLFDQFDGSYHIFEAEFNREGVLVSFARQKSLSKSVVSWQDCFHYALSTINSLSSYNFFKSKSTSRVYWLSRSLDQLNTGFLRYRFDQNPVDSFVRLSKITKPQFTSGTYVYWQFFTDEQQDANREEWGYANFFSLSCLSEPVSGDQRFAEVCSGK